MRESLNNSRILSSQSCRLAPRKARCVSRKLRSVHGPVAAEAAFRAPSKFTMSLLDLLLPISLPSTPSYGRFHLINALSASLTPGYSYQEVRYDLGYSSVVEEINHHISRAGSKDVVQLGPTGDHVWSFILNCCLLWGQSRGYVRWLELSFGCKRKEGSCRATNGQITPKSTP